MKPEKPIDKPCSVIGIYTMESAASRLCGDSAPTFSLSDICKRIEVKLHVVVVKCT